METNKEIKKAFALEQIRPYYKDESLCGIENGKCSYLTKEGKMCVLGKNLINPENTIPGYSAYKILNQTNGQMLLKENARNILTADEWNNLQAIHDGIALDCIVKITSNIACLGLFTYEELIA